ncbi:MAG: LD-carboxypeptidase [Vampirovibrionales bacterium]
MSALFTVSSPVIPRALPNNACLGIISPAAPNDPEALVSGQALLNAAGFRFKFFPNAGAHYHHLAGTDAQRLADLHAAFVDPEVDAILCTRGGYGCMRLLDQLDWDMLAKNPKWLIGFSDITALQIAFYQRLGWVSAYAPMLTSNMVGEDDAVVSWQWEALLPVLRHQRPFTVPNADAYQLIHTPALAPTVVEAPLLGGNLSLLAGLCGTPWQPKPQGHVLFIEDWNESHYTLDRKFQQLKLAGVFEGIAGVLLCDFSGIGTEPDGWPLIDFFKDWFADSPFPVGYGLSVGHGERTATLPQGLYARWEIKTGLLALN